MDDSARLLEHEVVDGVHVLRPLMVRLEDGTALLVLEDTLNQILEKGDAEPHVVINLASIEYLVTTALAKLMSFRTRVLAQGGRLYLCCLCPAVDEVLQITHFDRFFKIFSTEAEALQDIA